MIGAAAGILLPLLTALLLARRLAPAGARVPIVVPIAAIAAGLASAFAFALLTSGLHARSWFLAADAGIWIALAGFTLRYPAPTPRHPARLRPPWFSSGLRRGLAVAASRRRRIPSTPKETGRPFAIAVGVLMSATLAIALIWFIATSAVYPHGEWDAWAQWNLRARFFFRGFGDGTWRHAFAAVLAWSHADYPMLVPMSVARLWLYAGSESVAAPILFGGSISAATVLTAAFSVAHTRGAARGCLAAAVLLACPSFVRYSAAQCADIAVGFYLLCAFVLWSHAHDAPENRWAWMSAGTAAALAGWAKNEGLAGLGIFVALVAAERWWTTRSLRPAALVLAGAAPVLLVVVLFKMTLAPPSYFTAEQSFAQAIASLLDGGRLRLVTAAFARELWVTGASTVGILPFLAVFAAIRGIDGATPSAVRAAVPAMLLLLTVYAAAYVVTPKDLVWQLQTSLDRLVLQVVPTLTWAVVTVCR